MREDIYENIIENSKIAYLKINCKKDNNDKYVGINVIEQGKGFEKFTKLVSDNNFFNKDVTESLINSWINYKFKNNEFDIFVKDVIEKGYIKIENQVELKNKIVITDIYYVEKYFILVYNFKYNKTDSKEKIKVYNWIKDLNGVYLDAYEDYVNDSSIKRKMSIINKKDLDLWPINEVKIFRENEDEIISTGCTKTFYETVTNKSGRKMYIESTLWPLLDNSKNIIGTRGTSIEINDKIVFEKSMEQNEENFREITKYCESAFIIRDRKRATYVSPAFKNIFETDPDELYKDIDKLDNYFRRIEWNDKHIDNEFDYDKCNEGTGRIKLDNNKEKWIWYKFLPIKDLEGNVTKRVGILTDVTEKQKLEEEKNQIKLDFFANLSHELRTPINLISSTIQLFKMNLNKLSEEDAYKFYKYMDIMETNSFRLVKLINNLLDSTRIDEGFMNFNPVNADIIKFMEDICDSVVEFVKYNQMNLVFDTNIEEEIVLFDPELLERVMLNILSNAIKFNKIDGIIFVNIDSCKNDIKISIKDEGIGIPKEKIESIFERFQQVHSKNRIEKQGSGIGLYLVRSLIELHGGRIKINSEINKGSEFLITIPKKMVDLNEQFIINNVDLRHIDANIEFSDI